MSFVFVIAFLASMLFYGVILVGGVLFIRRQLRQIKSEDEGSIHHRILDEVETVRYQLEILSDRLRRLEEGEGRALDSGAEPAFVRGELRTPDERDPNDERDADEEGGADVPGPVDAEGGAGLP